MLKLGTQNIAALHLGEEQIKKAYLGETVVFVEGKLSRLPEGYTEVEYVESSGLAYIDTLINPTNTTDLIVDVEPLSAVSSSAETHDIAGCAVTPPGISAAVYFLIRWEKYCATGGIGLSASFKNAENNGAPRRMKLRLDANTLLFWEDEKSVKTSSYSSTELYLEYLPSIKIFPATSTVSCPMRLYSIQIYNGSDLSFEGVPCTDPTGAVGLYDLVEGEFYGNAGTGEFTAGPAV